MSEAPGIASGWVGGQHIGLRLNSKLQALRSCVKRQLPRKGDPCFCDIEQTTTGLPLEGKGEYAEHYANT